MLGDWRGLGGVFRDDEGHAAPRSRSGQEATRLATGVRSPRGRGARDPHGNIPEGSWSSGKGGKRGSGQPRAGESRGKRFGGSSGGTCPPPVGPHLATSAHSYLVEETEPGSPEVSCGMAGWWVGFTLETWVRVLIFLGSLLVSPCEEVDPSKNYKKILAQDFSDPLWWRAGFSICVQFSPVC